MICDKLERDEFVPVPGAMQFITRQNHANDTGRTGIAPFICDVCSTRLMSIFGVLSWNNSEYFKIY